MPVYSHQLFINQLDKTGSLEDIKVVCSAICEHYGFDYFNYIAQIPTSFVDPQTIHISGYPSGWQRRYQRKKYIKSDPLVHHCAENNTPIDWDHLRSLAENNHAIAKLTREASSYGLRNGISIPVHSRKGDSAVMSYSMDREDLGTLSDIQKSTPDLYLLSVYTHEAAMRIVHRKKSRLNKPKLTERERECLIWAAEGETAWDIANRLKISESTVTFHLQNAMKKLNANNRHQTIARAVVLGLITPDF